MSAGQRAYVICEVQIFQLFRKCPLYSFWLKSRGKSEARCCFKGLEEIAVVFNIAGGVFNKAAEFVGNFVRKGIELQFLPNCSLINHKECFLEVDFSSCSDDCQSSDCSTIIRGVAICLVHGRPARTPAYSSHIDCCFYHLRDDMCEYLAGQTEAGP